MFANHSLSLLTNDLCCVISILLFNYFRVFHEFYGREIFISFREIFISFREIFSSFMGLRWIHANVTP